MEQQWEVGQTVEVQSRTWAGINKPGGCAKITKVYMTDDSKVVVGLDVKYLVGGGSERQIDPCLVAPFETLARGGRQRRGRDFLQQQVDKTVLARRNSNKTNNNDKKAPATAKRLKNNNTNNQQRNIKIQQAETDPSTVAKEWDDEDDDDGDHVDVGSTEAAVEESQQQKSTSTTFSTPLKKRPRSSNNKPSKVTPIPSLVITGDAKDELVSPMFPDKVVPSGARDRCNDDDREENPHSSAVRRGLFRQNQSTDHQPPPQQEVDLDKKPCAEGKTQSTTAMTSTAVIMGSSSSSSLQQNVVARSGIDRITAARKPVQAFALSRKLEKQKKPSPSQPCIARAVAAGTECASSSSNNNRKALKDVYEYELQKAREFMDQMVGPPAAQKEDQGNYFTTSTLSPSSATGKKDGYMRTATRYDEFLSVFQTLRLQIDGEDGEISEAAFKERFQSMTSKTPFDVDELDGHIASLCNEGKIMRSDGVLYLID